MPDSKSGVPQGTGGSNPSLSASFFHGSRGVRRAGPRGSLPFPEEDALPDDTQPQSTTPTGESSAEPAAAESRAMGEQPLARMMRERGLSNHDLVAASARPIAHKLVMRAARGRRLTVHSKALVVEAFNRATGGAFRAADLFDY